MYRSCVILLIGLVGLTYPKAADDVEYVLEHKEEFLNLLRELKERNMFQLFDCMDSSSGEDFGNCTTTGDERQIFRFRKLFPGTHWCGNGNDAESKNDLGFLKSTDSCCRAHDKCPRNINGNSNKYGVENPSKYTISDCSCDDEFYSCLKAVKSDGGFWGFFSAKKMDDYASKIIGRTYFDLLKQKCLKFDSPLPANSMSGGADETAVLRDPKKFDGSGRRKKDRKALHTASHSNMKNKFRKHKNSLLSL